MQNVVEFSVLGNPEVDCRCQHVRCMALPMKGVTEKGEEEQGDGDRQDKDEEDKEEAEDGGVEEIERDTGGKSNVDSKMTTEAAGEGRRGRRLPEDDDIERKRG